MSSDVLSGDNPTTLKLVVIGSCNTGKSSLVKRYVHGEFNADERATIGVNFKLKELIVDHERVRLSLHDTAGEERFRCITPNFYRNANCVVLVYDVTDRATFAALQSWRDEVYQYTSCVEPVVMVVGNKIDLAEQREVSRAEGVSFARQNRTMFIETSALTSECVEQAFEELVRKALATPGLVRRNGDVFVLEEGEIQTRRWYFCWLA